MYILHLFEVLLPTLIIEVIVSLILKVPHKAPLWFHYSLSVLGPRTIWYLSILSIGYETDPPQRGTWAGRYPWPDAHAAHRLLTEGGPPRVVWKPLLLCTGSCVVLMSLMSFCSHVCADTWGVKGFSCELCRNVDHGVIYLLYVHAPLCSLVSEPVDVWLLCAW